jgi:hypothetical protein
VLAVGLLLAALSSAGVVGLVAGPSGSGTPIPGQPAGGQNSQGQGTSVGQVYRLQDGSYVFVPSGAPKTGATPSTGTTTPSPTASTGSAVPTAGTTTPTTPSTGTPGGGSTGF